MYMLLAMMPHLLAIIQQRANLGSYILRTKSILSMALH